VVLSYQSEDGAGRAAKVLLSAAAWSILGRFPDYAHVIPPREGRAKVVLGVSA